MSGGPKQVNVVPDPNIRIGEYRVLTRTDGLWILLDERNPTSFMTAAIKKSKEAIVEEAHRLVKLGSPQVFVNEKTGKQRRIPDAPTALVHAPPEKLGVDATDGGDRRAAPAGFRSSSEEPKDSDNVKQLRAPKSPKPVRGTP